jgi:hypothetical protein
MATLKEYTFAAAVNAAQGVKQVAYASAFVTYAPNGFGVVANFAAYITALVAADVAFYNSVISAATANGISPTAVDPALLFYPVTTASILT